MQKIRLRPVKKMKMNNAKTRILMLLIAAVMTFAGHAADTTQSQVLIARGDSAYADKDYFRAIELYDSARIAGGASSVMYYNLGNAYYRINRPADAILSYERALRIDPTNRDARLNLDFVQSKTEDKVTDSGNIMSTMADSITCSMRADSWATLTLVLFVVFLALAAGYIFGQAILLRKICFFGGMIVLIATVTSLLFSVAAARRINDDSEAIVTVPKAQLSPSPGRLDSAQGEELTIHLGHKVTIIDTIAPLPDGDGKPWYQIKVGNGSKAWIRGDQVERIAVK